jgi:16S rRNA (guanine966-N2)-methyltransferase
LSKRRAPARSARPATAQPKGEVRIIGGQWKRSLLPVADLPGMRPTPDRVRETLFNWLGQDLTGWRCADVFAGSGALGFEAASRGAAQVLMVEQQSVLVQQLQLLVQRLGASAVLVERGDGVAALQRVAAASLDLALIDPPFESSRYDAALQAAGAAVRPAGFVYLEAPRVWTDEALTACGLKVYRYLKAGAVHAHLLQRTA